MQVDVHMITKYSPQGHIHKSRAKEVTYYYNPVSSDIRHARANNGERIEWWRKRETRQSLETRWGGSPILM